VTTVANHTVLPGADRVAADPRLLGPARRIGFLTNDAARLRDGATPTRVALLEAGVRLVRLFGPEHGLGANAPDGAPVADARDPVTGLPVVSLYGAQLAPPPDTLADLDLLLVDMPDVGARFYTYAWTLTHAMDACAAAGVPVAVLDRPNPVGGLLEWVEGPLLDPACASFIGRHTIPVRHSLTLGELALLWARERAPGADVRVVECAGWARSMLWPATGLPFVPTSPAIGSFEAALLYPGLVLFEATNLSVGRGTPRSFRAIGAPWLDVPVLMNRVAQCAQSGVTLHEGTFTPATGPHAGTGCAALEIEVAQPALVRPVALGLALLGAVAGVHREQFAWSDYPTVANPTGGGHLERLLGVTGVREVIESDPAQLDDACIAGLTSAPGWPARWRAVARAD
jgi:uncharacterized protein YbbC (DUF1343 family)